MRCEMVNLELLEYKCSLIVKHELKELNASIRLVKVFPQMWGSTALGFNEWGGSAMTTALTTVFQCAGNYIVFFGERSAYCVSGEKSVELFMRDLKEERLPNVVNAKERYKED